MSVLHVHVPICCAGTWLDADSGLKHNQVPVPSNVTRLCRAIKSTSSDRIPQVVYYQAGVGTAGGPITRTVGGGAGAGLADNVREGYSFRKFSLYQSADEGSCLTF